MCPVTGIVLVDKPAGWTSFDVVAKLRGIFATRRAGHAGTLDPMATGVLPVFLGQATKACDLLPAQDKSYLAEVQLGLVTDTQDVTGRVLQKNPCRLARAQVEAVLPQFLGQQLQTPPMYSAVKVAGRRLYDLAREGREVERPARPIEIYSLNVTDFCEQQQRLTLQVHCSKGSYVRTLAHDLGQRLGCGAALAALRRTMAAGWRVEDCRTIETLQALKEAGRLQEAVLPVQSAFAGLPLCRLEGKLGFLYRNGVRLEAARTGLAGVEGLVQVWDEKGFVGIAWQDAGEGLLHPRKMFAERT